MTPEGKTVPHLRFPGFTGDVETHPLGTVTKVIDCKHRTPEYVEKGVPIVSPGTIRWGEIDLISPTKRVTEAEYVSLMDHCEGRFKTCQVIHLADCPLENLAIA